ncbi:hypothetical protein ACSQ67_011574 [Phaseolus vulgaris]
MLRIFLSSSNLKSLLNQVFLFPVEGSKIIATGHEPEEIQDNLQLKEDIQLPKQRNIAQLNDLDADT